MDQVHDQDGPVMTRTEPGRLPRDFQRATLRGVLPPRITGEIGLSFDREDGTVVRLVIDAESVACLRARLEPGAFDLPPREEWEFSDVPIPELLAGLSAPAVSPEPSR